ncbi:MAG: SAM-dependent methyltransferase [Anaerolineae bacterium]|nr:SAM-dependent methyltransferase [Anaerolineae bacterium]
MANQAAQTAYGPMVVVALEQHLPKEQRLVQDNLVIQFMPPTFRLILNAARWSPLYKWLFNFYEKQARGIWGGVLCRKRYIDDRLLKAVADGVQAGVILGAGLDTRAYRLPALAALPVFEVDLPENSAYKKAQLQKVFGMVPDHVTLTPLDFDTQDLGSALESQGYRPDHRSFFIWEAVTQYLTETGVRRTLDYLSQAKPGSRLVFTYVCKDFIDGTARYGLDKLYEIYRVKRPIWHFGLDPARVAAFLEPYGWKEVEQLGGQEYIARYLNPAGRPMPVMEIERVVYAEKV